MTAEENRQLIEAIDAQRVFLLMAYRDNPTLQTQGEEEIRRLFSADGTENDQWKAGVQQPL